MSDVKNKSNNELIEKQRQLREEFERVKIDLVKIYDYWISIEKENNKISGELNDRFGLNNK
jgi:hypothetical protein